MQKRKKPSCLYCGKETKRHTTKFCSRECRGKYRTKYKIRQGGPKQQVPPKICEFCGKVFQPKSWDGYKKRKFCSKQCAGLDREDRGDLQYLKDTPRFPISEETRRKMSIAATKRNAKRVYTKGIGGKRKDIGHYVRSRWEANICRLLNYYNISYQYEAEIIELKNNKQSIFYRPDLKLDNNVFIEVKGWWNEKSKLIKKLMKEQYPNIYIIYISEPEYKQLSLKYKNIIHGWEFDKNHGR